MHFTFLAFLIASPLPLFALSNARTYFYSGQPARRLGLVLRLAPLNSSIPPDNYLSVAYHHYIRPCVFSLYIHVSCCVARTTENHALQTTRRSRKSKRGTSSHNCAHCFLRASYLPYSVYCSLVTFTRKEKKKTKKIKTNTTNGEPRAKEHDGKKRILDMMTQIV